MWRVPPYDEAIELCERLIRETFHPLGMLVTGSIVRGEAGPRSDLDVWVLHDEPWRQRLQRRFAGVPAEIFINPPARVRGYFASEHADGRPCTAHMLATGEVVMAHPTLDELIGEAKDWLARPYVATPEQLLRMRYGAVDLLDDARDALTDDPASAPLLFADAVGRIVEYAFWQRGLPQPRRKRRIATLAQTDPIAAALVMRWETGDVAAVEELARHVLGIDTFFAWDSPREPSAAR